MLERWHRRMSARTERCSGLTCSTSRATRRTSSTSTSLSYPMLKDKDGNGIETLRRGAVPGDLRDRYRGPHHRGAPRRRGRAVHARRWSRCWRRAALLAALALALVALPVAAMAAGLPEDHAGRHRGRGDVPGMRHALGLASEAPQAQRERAYIERLIASCKSKDQVKQALGRRVRRQRARPAGRPGRRRLRRRARVRGARSSACCCRRRDRLPVVRWKRRGGGPGGRGGRALAAPTARDSMTTWSATTCDRPAVGRRHYLRRVRRRLHLVRLALRASARARLPLDHLGRLVRGHPGGPRAAPGAWARHPVLPGVHGDVRRRSA